MFIQSTSAEERSLRATDLLRKAGTKVDQNIVFCFEEVISRIGVPQKDFLDNYSLTSSGMVPVRCNLFGIENGIKSFYDIFRSKPNVLKGKKILIDISTFIKPYFYCLLKLLIQVCSLTEVYVTYTEPESYGKPLQEHVTFTRGLDRVGEIPAFNGFIDIDKKNMLIIMLGFEGQRALEVLRSVQPDKTLAINGFPAYRPEFKDVSLISNTLVIREGECFPELQYSSASDPFETYRTLAKLHKDWSNYYNFSIAPLGTKPMALGACLFALQCADTRLIYAYPQGYELKVAEKYGKTWMYEIFFE